MSKFVKDFKTFINESYGECHKELFEEKDIINDENKSKKKRKPDKRHRTCIVCGTPFITNCGGRKTCSDECMKFYREHRKEYLSDDSLLKLRNAGLKSSNVQAEIRRSKNEIYFCELCQNEFEKVTHNENKFNGWDADVLIYDFNIAVLWNGNWHYKEIKKSNSLNRIQNRDRIKVKEIENAGWIPYTIEDHGKFNKLFVEEEFKKLKEFIKSINASI